MQERAERQQKRGGAERLRAVGRGQARADHREAQAHRCPPVPQGGSPELKKVDWLSRRELISYTVVVLATPIVTTMYVAGLDYVFSKAILDLLSDPERSHGRPRNHVRNTDDRRAGSGGRSAQIADEAATETTAEAVVEAEVVQNVADAGADTILSEGLAGAADLLEAGEPDAAEAVLSGGIADAAGIEEAARRSPTSCSPRPRPRPSS